MFSSYVAAARLAGRSSSGLVRGQCLLRPRQKIDAIAMSGGRRCLTSTPKPGARAWAEERLAQAKKFLDHNPFVKLSLYGTAVFMVILTFVDYMMKGKKKAGPRQVSMLPFDCGGYLLQREEDVSKLLGLCQKFELPWQGSARVVRLVGSPLSGKTELLRQLAKEWQQKEGSGMFRSTTPVVITIEAHDTDDVLVQLHQAAMSLGCLANDVIDGGDADAFARLPPNEQISHLTEVIRVKLQERGHWLFVLDGAVAESHLLHLLPEESSQDWGSGVVVVAGDDTGLPVQGHPDGQRLYRMPDKLSPSQSLELLLASSVQHHSAELLRVNFGAQCDEITSAGEHLCSLLDHSPMAVALAGALVRWRQAHDKSDFWYQQCLDAVLERCQELRADLDASQPTPTQQQQQQGTSPNTNTTSSTAGSPPDPGLALVAVTSLLSADILSVGQQRTYQQQPSMSSQHSYSADTFIRENLAALGWLAADDGPVAVAFLRQHLQHPDFDMERAREQQLLQQRKELEAMQKMVESAAAVAAKSGSSTGLDMWSTMKSALPFGLGGHSTSSKSTGDDASSSATGAATAPATPGAPPGMPGAGADGTDVVDEILSTMKDYHLVRRGEVSDCAVVRMPRILATSVRHEHMLHGAENAENRHIARESAATSMQTQWGQRMNRFDASRCRLEYRKSLQTQLDRHKGGKRVPSRLASLLKYVDGVVDAKLPEVKSIRTGLTAAVNTSAPAATAAAATPPSSSTQLHAPAAASSSSPGMTSPMTSSSAHVEPMHAAPRYTVEQLDNMRGNVAAPASSDTFLRLHRTRLLSAVATPINTSPDTASGRVLRRYAMPAHVRIHNSGGGVQQRMDGGRDLWRGVSDMSDGERGRVLSLRAQIVSRCYRLRAPSIALLMESAESCGKAYGERAAPTLNALNLLANELRALSVSGAVRLADETKELLSQVLAIEDTIAPVSVTPEQAAITASTMFLLARLHADLGQFDDSRQLLERCLMLQQHVLNTADGQRYLVLYASTLIDIGNIMLSEGEAAVSIKTFSLALTLLRAVHGDNQVQVEQALQLQGAAQLLIGDKERSRESRSQATGVKNKVDMAVLI